MSAMLEVSNRASDFNALGDAYAADSVDAENSDFAELFRRLTAKDDTLKQMDGEFVEREKARVEAEMLDILLKRIGKNTAFSDAISPVLDWFGDRQNDFLSQVNSLTEFLPQAGEDLFASLIAMQSVLAEKFRNASGTGGVASVISNFQIDFNAQFNFTAMSGIGSPRQFSDDQVKTALGVNRATVKLEIMLQAAASADTTLDIGNSTSVLKVISENLTLEAMLKFYDPLVLDLAGDGVKLKALSEGVIFPLAGDQPSVRCGFVQGDDALLFLDRDGNGLCDDGRELFGDQEGHKNGFEKLRIYDDNGDGVIDEQDEIYARLRVWNDWNGDGVNTADENRSLADVGVKFINLGYREVDENDGGNLITERGNFGTFTGEIRDVIDAKFRCAG